MADSESRCQIVATFFASAHPGRSVLGGAELRRVRNSVSGQATVSKGSATVSIKMMGGSITVCTMEKKSLFNKCLLQRGRGDVDDLLGFRAARPESYGRPVRQAHVRRPDGGSGSRDIVIIQNITPPFK